MKKSGGATATGKILLSNEYEDIELSRNTGMAIYLSGFVFLLGFALVWHIGWLGAIGLIGAIACVIIRSFDEDTEYILPAAEVERLEKLAWKK